MARMTALSAALVAAISLGTGAPEGWADSPVVVESATEDVREAVIELLPDRERPTTLFEAELIAEEAAARATAWLRSEGYYAAEVTPEAQEAPVAARILISPGSRFTFAAPRVAFSDGDPDAHARAAVAQAIAGIQEEAPGRARTVLDAEALCVLRGHDRIANKSHANAGARLYDRGSAGGSEHSPAPEHAGAIGDRKIFHRRSKQDQTAR